MRRAFVIRALDLSSVGALLCVLTESVLAAESASSLPLRPSNEFDGWTLALKAIGVAVICLAIVAVVLYRMRGRAWTSIGGVSSVSAASVEWAKRVSPRTTLIVVSWRGKRYLLAENGGTTQVIDSHADTGPSP